MKKLFALVVVLVLALSAVSAFAAEMNWSDVEETASQIEGDFVTFDEIAVKIWMPAVLQAVELTDEDTQNGYIGYFMTEDESAAVAVQYVNTDGMTLEEYAAQLEEAGLTGIETGTVNGLPCVSYDNPESDATSISFTTEAGYILEVTCSPMSDEGFAATATLIAASIQGE